MSETDLQRATPYIGPRAFQSTEILFGRDQEEQELLDLLIAERIVLLFSPSGAGKTSLIEASLRKALVKERFQVLPSIRVNQEMPLDTTDLSTTNRYVHSVLLSIGGQQETAAPETAEESLSFYLDQCLAEAAPLKNQVLIFDQFEEILTIEPYNQAAKEAFFTQIGMALRNPRRWALFAIREDYVASLEPYLRLLPTRLRVTYRLDFLDDQSALEAIQQPARLVGVDFTDEAAMRLVDDLRRTRIQRLDGTTVEDLGPYVEPVQLQVACLQLWEKLPPDVHQIVEADIDALSHVDNALGSYYNERVSTIAKETGVSERKIREWFDRHLITDQNIRGQVLERPGESAGLDNRVIQRLVDAHLVRSDERQGRKWFELAHDRLISPIQSSNAPWLATNLSLLQQHAARWDEHDRSSRWLIKDQLLVEAEEWGSSHAAELTLVEQEFLDACREAYRNEIRQERANRLIRMLAIIVTLTMLISLVAGFIALREAANAQNALTRADQETGRANDAAATAQAAKVQAEQQAELARNETIRARNAEATAESERARAESQATLARNAEATALAESKRAETQAQVALARQLEAQQIAQLDDRYDLALLIGLEAQRISHETQPTGLAYRSVLNGLVHNSRLITFLRGSDLGINSVAFSPDGTILAAATCGTQQGNSCIESKIQLWDPITQQLSRAPLTVPQAFLMSLAFSPDGKLLAAGGTAGTTIWNIQTGQLIGSRLPGLTASAFSVAFSPNGKILATAGSEDTIRLWNVESQQPLGPPLTGHTRDINSIAFNHDGTLLASGSNDGTIILWNVATRQADGTPLIGHKDGVLGVSFSPDGRLLATGGVDDMITIWDIATRKPIGQPLTGHIGDVHKLAFTPDGKKLVSASNDNTLIAWDVASRQPIGEPLRGHTNSVLSVAFSPKGDMLASGSLDTTVILWNLEARSRFGPTLQGHRDGVRTVAFSPDGSTLASGSYDGTIIFWDMMTAQPLDKPLTGHTDGVLSVAFSPDGSLLASSSEDNTIILWNAMTRRPVGSPLKGHTDDVYQVTFSPDGKVLASASRDKTVILWDIATQQQIGEPLKDHFQIVYTATFSPDGKILVSGGNDGTIIFWDVAARQPLSPPIKRHKDGITDVAFSRDGTLLASASADKQIIIWDVATQNPKGDSLIGHTNSVLSVVFSPDGRTIASSSYDNTIILWDVLTRQPIGPALTGHQSRVTQVTFNPSGNLIASASADTTVMLWDIDPQLWLRLTCSIVNRNLTSEEWKQYMGAGSRPVRTCSNSP